MTVNPSESQRPDIRPEVVSVLASLLTDWEPGKPFRHPGGRMPTRDEVAKLKSVTSEEIAAAKAYLDQVNEHYDELVALATRLWRLAAQRLPEGDWSVFVNALSGPAESEDTPPSVSRRQYEVGLEIVAIVFKTDVLPHLNEDERAEAEHILERIAPGLEYLSPDMGS